MISDPIAVGCLVRLKYDPEDLIGVVVKIENRSICVRWLAVGIHWWYRRDRVEVLTDKN